MKKNNNNEYMDIDDKMNIDNINIDKMNIDKMNIDNININKMNIDNINIDKMNIDNINIDKMNIDNINIDNININNINIDNNNIKKNLIIRPRCGLTNQLTCIAKGIIYAHITNRDLFIDNFQIDYRDYNNFINVYDIIDIEKLQKTINNLNLNVTIKESIILNNTIKKINTFTDTKIYFLKDIIPILFYEENNNIINLDIDNPISCVIPDEYEIILQEIMIEIDFVQQLKNISNNIIKKLKLNNYTCIHLRLENDAINYINGFSKLGYDNTNIVYKSKYLLEYMFFNNNKNNTYVCTSLKEDDINFNFYKELKLKFNLKDKNDIINEIISENNNIFKSENCRELFGIIDYLVAKNASYFLGCDWSGFSIYINYYYKKYNKYSKLINIWNSIKSMN
jgi:hypothetical protein